MEAILAAIKNQYGIDLQARPERGYLFEQADVSWRSGKFCQPSAKSRQTQESFKNVAFADDNLFRAYKKRTRKMHSKMLKAEDEVELTEEQRLTLMAEDLQD